MCGRWYLPDSFYLGMQIIYSYVQGFFYCSQEVMILSPQDGKVVNGDIMTRDVNMVNGGWGLQMFLVPLRHGNIYTCINANTIQCDTCTNNNNDALSTPNLELRSQKTSNNNNNNQGCWVINFSKTPLTNAQQSLLSHGPNFVIVPREPPTCEYIAATEKACLQLAQGKAEELRGEVKALLRKDHKVKTNISREEHQALREMKRDNTRMVLTADKGVSLVVLDRDEYTAKSEELLQQPNYKILKTDPTTKHKNKLISLPKVHQGWRWDWW